MDPRQTEELAHSFYRTVATNLRKEQDVERAAVVLPAQRGIDYGSRWARYVPDKRGCAWGHDCYHFHWGRVLSVREYALGRLNAGDSPEEIEENVEGLRLRHMRGWRLSEVHCDASQCAELQSVAMAGVWPVKPVEYGMAKADHFDGRRIREQAWFRSLFRRYKAETSTQAQAAGLAPGEPLFIVNDEGGH